MIKNIKNRLLRPTERIRIPSSIKTMFFWLKTKTKIRSRFREILRKISFAKKTKQNLVWKNIHEGKRCFILGTGPSLKQQDLSVLKNEWTFATAGFYLHPQFDIVHPKFYAIIDSDCFREDDPGSKRFIENISDKIHPDTVMIFLINNELNIKKRGLFSKNKIIYLNALGCPMNDENPFHLNIDKEIPGLQNVILANIICANYMGFKTMYLMGVEHDWLTKPSTMLCDDKHFYEGRPDSPQMNILTKFVPYEKSCYFAFCAFMAHRLLKEKMGDVEIFNLTPNSFLDVYPFKKYEDVVRDLK